MQNILTRSATTFSAMPSPTAKAIGTLELVAQLRRFQVFAQVCEALLQRQTVLRRSPRCWCERRRATSSTDSRRAGSSHAKRGRRWHASRLSPAIRLRALRSARSRGTAARWLTQAQSTRDVAARDRERGSRISPATSRHSSAIARDAECIECELRRFSEEPRCALKEFAVGVSPRR